MMLAVRGVPRHCPHLYYRFEGRLKLFRETIALTVEKHLFSPIRDERKAYLTLV
jgi:hypothetical protein